MVMTVFPDAFVSINGNDLRAQTQSVELSYLSEVTDAAGRGVMAPLHVQANDAADGGAFGGLEEWALTLNFFNDFAADGTGPGLFIPVGRSFELVFRPNSPGEPRRPLRGHRYPAIRI